MPPTQFELTIPANERPQTHTFFNHIRINKQMIIGVWYVADMVGICIAFKIFSPCT
jgi:hypothetical protein